MAKCDVCGMQVGLNDRVFTPDGGALCRAHMAIFSEETWGEGKYGTSYVFAQVRDGKAQVSYWNYGEVAAALAYAIVAYDNFPDATHTILRKTETDGDDEVTIFEDGVFIPFYREDEDDYEPLRKSYNLTKDGRDCGAAVLSESEVDYHIAKGFEVTELQY